MGFITRCLIVFFCLISHVSAEQIFSRFGVDDGLPDATIYSIVQDKTGFLWLGSTNSGLLRFDGYRFTEFPVLTAEELQQQQTADVGVIMLDDENNIWAGTWGFGVSVIEAGTGKLTRYTGAQKLAGEQIQVLFQDSLRHVWVGSTTGLSRITPEGTIQSIGETGQRIWSLAESADGTVWIGTATGLYYWRQETGLSQPILLKEGADSFSRDNEMRALKVVNNTLWVGTRSGLYRFATAEHRFEAVALEPLGQSQPLVNVIAIDDSNNMLMIGSYNGLYRYPLQSKNITQEEQRVLLKNVNVRSILLDRSNVLWLGSRESGLYRSIVSSKAFDDFNSLHPSLDIREPFSVTAVLQRQQQLWLGNTDSLHLVDLHTGQHQIIPTASRVNAIKATSDGTVYIATDSGLLRYDGGAELQKVDEPFELSGVVNRNVRDLAIAQDGTLYLGMWGEGVIGWKPDQAQTRRWLTQLAQHAAGNAVQSVFVGANATLWVGTRYSGLFQIDLLNDSVKRHSSLGETALKLPHNDVQCVSELGSELAVCSREGLLIYNLQSGALQHLTTEDGLPNNAILGVLQQSLGRLWVITAKGLGYRPISQHHFISYNSNDGMVSSELNAKTIFASSEQVFLGAIAGLVVVSPSQLNINARAPQPVLSALTIDQQNTLFKPHQQVWPDINLQSGQRSLVLEFSALDYQDPARNRFQYKLEGIDSDWIASTNHNKAFYANLPVGRYTLWLKASNNHGFFSEKVNAATIVVLPQWWQQNWLIYSAVISVFMLLWFMHLYRLRHIRQINRLLQDTVEHKAKAQLVLETRVAERTRALEESSVTLSLRTRQLERSLEELASRNAELKRVDKLKDEFIATVSHELRTPLTAIRGAIGLIVQNVVRPDSEPYQNMLQTAQANSERLAHLINDLLDLQKFTTGTFSLRLVKTDLVPLVQQAVTAMQPYAQRFAVELLLNSDVNEAWVMADPTRIRQVMDNLISNAIKFSAPDSKVIIRIGNKDAEVVFEVEDFGSGIPDAFKPRIFDKFSQADGSDSRAKEGTGLGLAICKKIIENHQGQIGFHSVVGEGATFWFSLHREQNE